VREFQALWLAQLLSVIGDQLARVALTILVYDRTRSAVLAAITFVCSIVPSFAGGLMLGWMADRYPRRAVMIGCDLVRFAVVLVMVVPGMPVATLVVLLFLVTLAGAPFTAARAALYPTVLAGDRYVVGNAVTLTTNQLAQVIGFAAGGALVSLLRVRGCLVADATTFAASALIVRLGVLARPAAGARGSRLFSVSSALRLVFGSPALRIPMLFGWLGAFYDVPEGVVTPLAHDLGGGAATVGLLLAIPALGVTVGTLLFSRLVPPSARRAWMGPLAVACTAMLVLFAFRPPLAGTLAVLAVSGLCVGYQTVANAAFVQAAPSERRGEAFGLAQGGINLSQGVAMIAAGALAQVISPALVISIFGGVGTCAAAVLAVEWLYRIRALRVECANMGLGPAGGAHDAYLHPLRP